MRRHVKVALAAAIALAAAPAAAQLDNALERIGGVPAGLAVPVTGAAVAEEPDAPNVNPAGIGFVREPALQYFHEGQVTPGSQADGVWAATALGPLGLGFSMEWLRPGDAGDALSSRYQRTSLALSLSDGRLASAAIAWHWIASPDPSLRDAGGWDLGLTLRPARWLSVGAAALGFDASLAGARLPRRYDLGLGTRFLGDSVTLSADLLADDRARDDFHLTHLVAGAGVELHSGVGLAAQVEFPITGDPAVSQRTTALLSLTWNAPHVGWTGGAASLPGSTAWLAGVRVSQERYRAAAGGDDVAGIDLAGVLSPPRTLFLSLGDRDPYGTLLARLAAARDDPEVGAVALAIDGLPIGTGRVEELRARVSEIRARKPVLAYLSGGGQREYYLACAASAIAVPPASTLIVNGLATSTLFLRDALARLGVAFEVVKAGAYKSAPEPLTRNDMSPEAREEVNALLDDGFARQVEAIAAARHLTPDRVRALVDQGLFTSEEARAAGLVDAVLWPDEVEGWARGETGRRMRLDGRWRPDPPRVAQRWGPRPVVALVRLEGAIASGRTRREPFGTDLIVGADTLRDQLRRAADDPSIRAIVLRVDSPGGDGLASDLVWHEVVRARRRKPVIASMGDIAASGGYLVAVGADQIVAEPSTLTGSIGVFVVKPDLSGTLAKLGVTREAVARGEKAQLFSLARPWSASERQAVEQQIDAFYRSFVDRVAEGRKLPRADAERLAGGRVWTGQQAYDRRLVDRLGSLDDAVALARERAGIDPGADVELRRIGGGGPGLVETALGGLAEVGAPAALRALAALPEVRALGLLAEMGPVLALPVPWIEPVTGE